MLISKYFLFACFFCIEIIFFPYGVFSQVDDSESTTKNVYIENWDCDSGVESQNSNVEEGYVRVLQLQHEKKLNCKTKLSGFSQISPYACFSFGESPGFYESYGGVGANYRINNFFYGDTAVYYTDDDNFCLSQGVGFYTMNPCIDAWVSSFIYFDYMDHKSGSFQQISLCFSGYWNCYLFDFNAYIPIGTTSRCGSMKCYNDYDTTGSSIDYFVTAHADYTALYGLEALIGKYFCIPCNVGPAYLGVGLYYLNNADNDETLGVKTNFDYEWNKYFSINLQGTYDKDNDFLARCTLLFTYPLYETRCQSKCNEIGRKNYRDNIIKLSKCCTYEVNY